MLRNTIDTFGSLSRLFHWVVGIMVIGLLCVGFYMTDMPDSAVKWKIYSMHKATGMVVLVLVGMRILWRVSNLVPSLPSTMLPILQNGYKVGINLMYLLMLIMPLSGLLMSLYGGHDVSVYGLFTVKAFSVSNKQLAGLLHTIHVYSGIILACIVAGHIMLSLYHHLVVKDRLLMRMIVGK